jgi:glycosyltransferase involved in cell wall biosynthesis
MPRLLLITFHYPPRPTIGSLRPGALAKYLPQLGWEVVVVTPRVPAGPRPPALVYETPYQDALEKWKTRIGLDPHRALHAQLNLPVASKPRSRRFHTKVIHRLKSVLAYPDDTMGWARFAINAIKKIDGPIDAILSTAPPITTHVIAREARSILKCPWIADFRDLWATNLDNPNGAFFRMMDRRLEKRWLGSADALVTVSRPWADRLQECYPDKPVHVITNGFDPDDFARERAPLSDCFSISYTGQLYAGRRDPTALFEVVHELIEEKIIIREQMRIRFYGPIEPWVEPMAERYGLQGVVEVHGSIGRNEALQRQQESQVLLLLGWANPQETGQHTGKLFEYFGARRPILAVGGVAGVLTETLAETATGVHALSKAQLRRFLIEAYTEFRERGEVRFRGNQNAIAKYTHQAMARSFAELLDTHQRNSVPLPDDQSLVPSVVGSGSGGWLR